MKNKVLEITYQSRRFVILIEKVSYLVENENYSVIYLDNGKNINCDLSIDELMERIGWSE